MASIKRMMPGGVTPGKAQKENIISKMKERKKEKNEEESKKIAGSRARIEQQISGILRGIDFAHSKLPHEVLFFKSRPELPYTDLQLTALNLAKMINSTAIFSIDITLLDEMILRLADEFRNAVEAGDVMTTEAAKKGLYKCITEIRDRIPNVSVDEARTYVKNGREHVDDWLKLLALCRACDYNKKQLPQIEKEVEKAEKDQNDNWTKIQENMKNPEFVAAVNKILGVTNPTTDIERLARTLFVRQEIIAVRADMQKYILYNHQMTCAVEDNKVKNMFSQVITARIADPGFNEEYYRESIDKTFEAFARNDKEIEDAMKSIAEVRSRLKNLENSAGEQAVSTVALQGAKKVVEQLKEKQNQGGGAKLQLADELHKMGLRTEEEQTEYEIQQAKLAAEMANTYDQGLMSDEYVSEFEDNSEFLEN